MREALLEVRDLKSSSPRPTGSSRPSTGSRSRSTAGRRSASSASPGSGKSVTCLTALGLINRNAANVSGEIMFMGRDLLKLAGDELQSVRGKDLAMIFQDPFACLHPMYRVGDQIVEAVQVHEDLSKQKARDRAVELLEPSASRARERFKDYPHQYSGGMRQRAMIAMALVHNPDILIADEPTTALDVTVQAQILELIDRIKREFDIGVVLITHDLGVIADVAQTVMVMYAGRAMELGSGCGLHGPLHPYAWGCWNRRPRVDQRRTPRPDRGRTAVAHSRAAGLSVPSALPPPLRAVRQGDSGIQDRGGGHPEGVPPGGRGQAAAVGGARVATSEGRGLSEISASSESGSLSRRGGDPLVRVEHLTEVLPDHARNHLPEGSRPRPRGRGRELRHLSRRDGRARGESGCGKSTTARLVLKLLDATSGSIMFEGRDIT